MIVLSVPSFFTRLNNRFPGGRSKGVCDYAARVSGLETAARVNSMRDATRRHLVEVSPPLFTKHFSDLHRILNVASICLSISNTIEAACGEGNSGRPRVEMTSENQ